MPGSNGLEPACDVRHGKRLWKKLRGSVKISRGPGGRGCSNGRLTWVPARKVCHAVRGDWSRQGLQKPPRLHRRGAQRHEDEGQSRVTGDASGSVIPITARRPVEPCGVGGPQVPCCSIFSSPARSIQAPCEQAAGCGYASTLRKCMGCMGGD